MLRELIDGETIDSDIGAEHKNIMDITNHRLMLSKLFQSQGSFEGFFNMRGQQVSEKFTLMIRKKPDQNIWDIATSKQNNRLQLIGYGQNSVWDSFWLDGSCEVITVPELTEKEGLKVEHQSQNEPMFMKLKVAKFMLKKRYSKTSLREELDLKKQLAMQKAQQEEMRRQQ